MKPNAFDVMSLGFIIGLVVIAIASGNWLATGYGVILFTAQARVAFGDSQ
jgi:hypothetical protein